MNLKMYKACLRLFFLGTLLVFTTIPSLADETRYDDPSHVFSRRLFEDDIENKSLLRGDKKPFRGERKLRNKQERSLQEDGEEGHFTEKKPPIDNKVRIPPNNNKAKKLPLRHLLEKDVEDKNPFHDERNPRVKQERSSKDDVEDVEEKSPFFGEKSPDDKGENSKNLLENNDIGDKRPFFADRPPSDKGNRPERLLDEDVEEKSPFYGEKPPSDEGEKQRRLLTINAAFYVDEERSLKEVKKPPPYNPNWKRILATEDEFKKTPFKDETKPNYDVKSPFKGETKPNYDIKSPTGVANAPKMSQSANMKSSKPQTKRSSGSFYVEKPREHRPLLLTPKHDKPAHRRLLGEPLGQ